MPDPVRLLTVDEVADYLQISRKTVYELCKGPLQSSRVMGSVRVHPEDLYNYQQEIRGKGQDSAVKGNSAAGKAGRRGTNTGESTDGLNGFRSARRKKAALGKS